MNLDGKRREMLEAAHDAHEGGVNAGVAVRPMTDEDMEIALSLMVDGLGQFHPPGAAALIFIPTPLGRERVLELRERSKKAKRAARRRKAKAAH